MKLYMFRTVRLPITRILFTVHSAMVYVIQVSRQLSSRTRHFALFQGWMENKFGVCMLFCYIFPHSSPRVLYETQRICPSFYN